jgi:hypothetical protein
MRKVPYTLHREREEQYNKLAKQVDAERRPDASKLKAAALLLLRTNQKLDAICAIAGRTVHAYKSGKFIGKVSHCHVGDATATICFILEERDDNDAISNHIAVTADMDIFVENSLV